MGASIVFLSAFSGLTLLIGFKLYELKRGVKPLSSFRYELDMAAQRHIETGILYLRYINWQTAKLLFIFFATEITHFIIFVTKKIGDSKLGMMVSGKDIPVGNETNGGSQFLKDISSIKSEGGSKKKNSSN